MTSFRRAIDVVALLCLFLIVACGAPERKPTGVDTTGTPPTNPPTNPPTGTSGALTNLSVDGDGVIEPGGGKKFTVIVSAPTTYTGTVTFAVTPAVSGITIHTRTQTISGGIALSEISVLAGADAAAGNVNLTVTANATGLTSATKTLALTIRPIGSFTIGTVEQPSADPPYLAPGGEHTDLTRITRLNYPGPIKVIAEAVPAGLEVVTSQTTTTDNSTYIVIKAAPTLPNGTYTFTWRASGVGQPDRTQTQRVVVRDLGSYSMRRSPDTATIAQGRRGEGALVMTRRAVAGFPISPIYMIESQPAGITLARNISSVGDSVPFSVAVSASVPLGTYTALVSTKQVGMAKQLHTIPIKVVAPSTANDLVTLDFSQCAFAPEWVAYQDGAAAWQRVTAANRIYVFPISATTGAYAFVPPPLSTSTEPRVQIRYGRKAELTSRPLIACSLSPVSDYAYGGSVSGTFSSFDEMFVTLGSLPLGVPGAMIFPPPASQHFWLGVVGSFPRALVGWRSSQADGLLGSANPDRGYIRRSFTPVNRSVGVIDLADQYAFDPLAVELQADVMTTQDRAMFGMSYLTEPGCEGAPLYTATTTRMSGRRIFAQSVPAARQAAGDLHASSLEFYLADNGPSSSYPINRKVTEYARLVMPKTVLMPAQVTATSVTPISAAYSRLSAVVNIPAEYNRQVVFTYEAQGKAIRIAADREWIGSGTAATLTMPDFSSVAGWNNAFAPTNGATGKWTLVAEGDNLAYPGACVEGSRVVRSVFSARY